MVIHGAIMTRKRLQQISRLHKMLRHLGAILPRFFLTVQEVLLTPLQFLSTTLQFLLAALKSFFLLLLLTPTVLESHLALFNLPYESALLRPSHQETNKKSNAKYDEDC